MNFLVLPITFLCALSLAGCGGSEQSDASVERGASVFDKYNTICVQNDSSRSISSRGDGSEISPEGFLVRPGESACAAASPDAGRINQEMMSDTGPSWTTKLYRKSESGKRGQNTDRPFLEICDNAFNYRSSPYTFNLSCGGNPFSLTVEFKSPQVNIIFADQ